MATLSGKTLFNSYKELLKLDNATGNTGITTSLQAVEDGSGVDTALQLSTTAAKINGSFEVGTGNATVLGGTLSVSGAITGSGGYNGSVGATTPSTGAFTSLTTSGTIELGHATDTTLSRGAAGRLQVESVDVVTTTSTDTLTNKTLTSPTINTGTISGGTINNAVIGGTTAAAGSFTTLSATSPITTQAGTFASPAIQPTGDTNTGIFFPAADTIAFSEGGTESMRIDSSGNVGIGITSPANRLHIIGTTAQTQSVSIGAGGNAPVQIALENGYGARQGIVFQNTGSASYPSFGIISENTALAIKTASYNIGSTSDLNTNWTERLRIESSGNVGIGITPSQKLDVNGGSAIRGALFLGDGSSSVIRKLTSSTPLTFANYGGSAEMTIDSSGNVGIGTTSPHSPATAHPSLDIAGGANKSANIFLHGNNTSGVSGGLQIQSGSDASAYIYNHSNTPLVFGTNATERLRITSGGDVLVGRALPSGYGKLQVETSVSSDWSQYNTNSATTEPRGIRIRHSVATPNNTSAFFIWCEDATRERFYVTSNGGVYNFSANNANLSDERLKTDIHPSPSYLSKICSIPVVNFKFKDQTHEDYNLGVIAQQVEAVCPELVDVDGFGETPEDGVPLKAIYQTDLQYALMKCIQELKAENDILKARITALEAA